RMRLISGRAVSTLPTSDEALDELAVAVGYQPPEAGARHHLLAELTHHRHAIEAVYRRLVEDPVRPETLPA
ncbi:MAG: hypothetical protein ACE5HU_03770, partial [Acidobacteriota bacterium]